MKKNIKKIKKYFTKQKGFALLYAVVISSIIFAIAISVSNMALREVIFGTSAKDANDAFYAADTAAECTLYYDTADIATNVFDNGDLTNVYCGGNIVTHSVSVEVPPNELRTTFEVSNLGTSGKSCAKVMVEKDTTTSKTKITSVGYNTAGNNFDSDCIPNQTSVQRVLELNY